MGAGRFAPSSRSFSLGPTICGRDAWHLRHFCCSMDSAYLCRSFGIAIQGGVSEARCSRGRCGTSIYLPHRHQPIRPQPEDAVSDRSYCSSCSAMPPNAKIVADVFRVGAFPSSFHATVVWLPALAMGVWSRLVAIGLDSFFPKFLFASGRAFDCESCGKP